VSSCYTRSFVLNYIISLHAFTYKIIEELSLGSNFLTGTIPTELGTLSNLIVLNIGRNTLEGTIPSEIGQITTLRDILFYFNDLTQNIPIEFAMLSNLRNLLVEGNLLSGEVPLEVCQLHTEILFYFYGVCRSPKFTCDCCAPCY
jgi:Leucine-rich repeat (LRR) protein